MHKHDHKGKSTQGSFDLKDIIDFANISKDPENILDLGCGDGYFSLYLANRFQNKKIFSQDIYDVSINKLISNIEKDKIPNVYPILGDAKKIPVEANYFDKIFIINVFHGFVANKEEKEIINEIIRVSKSNSKLYIVEFKKTKEHNGFKMSFEDIYEILENYGYTKGKSIDISERHYIGEYIR